MTRYLDASVIIPTYNRSSSLRMTLRSLTGQKLVRDRFEVIVVDDGSSDDTADVVKQFSPLLNLHYTFQRDEGYRLAKARNKGISLASGEICIFLDSGNIVSEDFVEAHVAAHSSGIHEAVIGYIYGYNHTGKYADKVLDLFDENDISGSFERISAHQELADVREEFYTLCFDDIDRFGMAWALFWGGNISLSSRFVRQIGGYDEWYQSWGNEDIDLGLASKLAGAHFTLARRASAIEFPHPKELNSRMKSWVTNMDYLNKKFCLPETERLLHVKYSRELIIESLERRISQ